MEGEVTMGKTTRTRLVDVAVVVGLLCALAGAAAGAGIVEHAARAERAASGASR